VEYTALGDAVNLAARMEQTAQPGTVQISADTHRQVAPLFDFEDLGGVEVKGKSEPVQAYRVLRRKARPGPLRGIEGLDAPQIGRDKEMSALSEAIANLRQGRGQIASVMGEAGLGKSRLVAELRHALERDGPLSEGEVQPLRGSNGASQIAIGWHEGRCLSYESSTPYSPFVNLLRTCFRLRAEQAEEEEYDQIRTQIGELMPGRVAETAPFIATMLGINVPGADAERVRYLQPPQVRQGVFRATCDYLSRLAEAQPLVLVFEDLHWIDPTSLDLLDQLMSLTNSVAMMIIGVFRPLPQEPSWRFHETAARDYSHRHTSIALEPLDANDSRALVANLLHVEDLPEKVRALILAKAEGNPFFVEEVIRSLLDANLVVRVDSRWRATREIQQIAVPDTLAGVINARLDRLDDESKFVAQTASVIGREFQLDTLADVHDSTQPVDEALTDLQRRELIREKSRVPRPIYMYKHALTQETAYNSLLMSRRRELHRRVAECLERIEPERVNEIARHYLEAREEARALPYLVDAGDRAARAYSSSEAIGYYERALQISESAKDVKLARRAFEGLGGALKFAYDIPRAVENYHAMLHAAQELGDLPMQVSAMNKLGFVTALMQGQFPEAEEHLVDAERLARECDDLPGLAELHMTYCYIHTATGNFEGAVDHLSEAAQIGRDLELEEPRLFGLTHTANTLTYMTRFEEAWPAAQEARQLAEDLGNRMYLSELLALTMPFSHLRNGELDAARQSAHEGTEIAAEIGALLNESAGALTQGQIAWLRGDYQGAIAFYERALEAGRGSGMAYLQAAALCGLGTAHLDISPRLSDKTDEFHSEAIQLMEMPLGKVLGAMIWAELGFCAMAMGGLDNASEYFEKGLTNPSAPMYLLRPLLLVGCAFVAMARNDTDQAQTCVRDARQFAEERAMKHLYPFVELADGRVRAALGETKPALQSFARCEELALEMQMRPLVWQARASAAQVLSALGHAEEADEKGRMARAMIDEIAGLFEDDSLRAMYVESATQKLE
jgi:tetratricopeptide (TPR) repeat protein